MKCVCCGIELSNNLDTFGDVGIEMCWSCWSELWQDRIYRVFVAPHDIWGDDFYNSLAKVECDPNNTGKFIVTFYCDSGRNCTEKNVDGDRLAFRDNTDELTAKLTTVLELVRKVVSGRRLLNIGERQATLEAWYENNPNVTNEYREAEAALDTLAALLADLDAGKTENTEPESEVGE